jgi:hypothetical protein
MAVDIKQGFKDAKEKLDTLQKTQKIRTEYENRVNNFTDKLQDKSDKIQLNLDSAEISRKIKQTVSNSFTELVSMLQTSTSGKTSGYITKVLKKTLIDKPSVIKNIIMEEVISSLGCSEEQTFQTNQELYVDIGKIDIFKQLNFDPNSTLGASIYETKNYSENGESPRSTNRFFHQVIQDNGVQSTYYGASGQALFKISFETFNGIEQGYFFKVILLDRLTGTNQVTEFLFDYFESLKILDYNNAVTKIVNLVLNAFSVNAGTGPVSLNDEKSFVKILQRILGMCFDYDKEIDVGGVSKYPEYDDTTDTLFEFTPSDLSQIENEIDLIRRGYVEFIDCNNIQLPITDTGYIFDIISQVNDDGSNIDENLQEIFFNLSNDSRWQLQLPQIFNASYNEDIINNFVKGVLMSVLSPKIIFPLVVMGNAIFTTIDSAGAEIQQDLQVKSPGLMAFSKKNKRFLINAVSRIGGVFLEGLFLELKKDIIKIVKGLILFNLKTKNERLYLITQEIIKRFIRFSPLILSLKKDFRECKSLLKYIYALLSITTKFDLLGTTDNEQIPTSVLALTYILEGSSPERELEEYIEEMKKLGLPVGTGINGEPDLESEATFAKFRAVFKERSKNGKVEGVMYGQQLAPTGQPTGIIRITGKPI